MRTLGNILWFIIGGWWHALIWLLWGVLFCCTIVGIPIGKACFQYAKLIAFPFGKVVVRETFIKGKENVSGIRRFFGTLANIIWLPIGIFMFFMSIGTIILSCITIIFIPYAIILARSVKFTLWPVGAKVITKEEYQAILNAQMINNMNGAQINTSNQVNQIPQTQSGGTENKTIDKRIVSLVLGVLSIILTVTVVFTPIGFILGIVAVVFGIMAYTANKDSKSIAAVVFSIASILINIIATVVIMTRIMDMY